MDPQCRGKNGETDQERPEMEGVLNDGYINHMKYQLPDIVCDRCILQMRYREFLRFLLSNTQVACAYIYVVHDTTRGDENVQMRLLLTFISGATSFSCFLFVLVAFIVLVATEWIGLGVECREFVVHGAS